MSAPAREPLDALWRLAAAVEEETDARALYCTCVSSKTKQRAAIRLDEASAATKHALKEAKRSIKVAVDAGFQPDGAA